MKFYIYTDGTHTHALQQRGRWNDNESEMTMKIRWDLLNQEAKRGTQKKRERANTDTTHLAQSGQTLKGQGKKKRRPTWTNLPQRNLSLPKHAQDPTYL